MGKKQDKKTPWAIGAITLGMLIAPLFIKAQDLPEDEVQFNLNTYIDNFRVLIAYPTLNISKKLSPNTSVSGLYLLDAISAASMKSKFEVDGVTSATKGEHGGGDDTPDELRNEASLGIVQKVQDNLISINGIYSTEHDYTSKTLAGQVTVPLAQKNTVITLGLTKSWDLVYPQTRTWEKEKNVSTYSGAISQVLSKTMLGQLDFSYSLNEGMLSDAYQVVNIIDLVKDTALHFEPVSPNRRRRYAVGGKTRFKTSALSALEIGYRYYWDSWEVTSHTISTLYQHRLLNDNLTLGYGFRSYFQSRASFFKEEYSLDDKYLAVDSKLDGSYSNELQFKVSTKPQVFSKQIKTNNFALQGHVKGYHRHTDLPDWHSNRRDLFALTLGVGVRHWF